MVLLASAVRSRRTKNENTHQDLASGKEKEEVIPELKLKSFDSFRDGKELIMRATFNNGRHCQVVIGEPFEKFDLVIALRGLADIVSNVDSFHGWE